MTLNEVYSRLKKLDIPVTYNFFKENPSAPYAVYYETGGENYGADYCNFIRKRNVKIELYCKDKNQKLEAELESLFSDCEINVSEDYIENADLIRITYSFLTINKINV